MRLRNLSLILGLSLCFWAHAEGEEGKAEKGGAVDKGQREFTEKSAKMNSLAAKIEEANKRFESLVKEKNESKDTTEKQRLIEELATTDAERQKNITSYEHLKSELSLRYPSRGTASERNYQIQGEKAQIPTDNAGGLDELLTRTKKIIDQKYAPFNPEPENVAAPKPASVEVEAPERLKLEK